jgi:putative oxidoreductase
LKNQYKSISGGYGNCPYETKLSVMNFIDRIRNWGDHHHPAWLDFFRVALGVVIFLKGITFLGDTDGIAQIVSSGFRGWSSFALVHYIAFAHLVGGVLIAIGMLTRIAILFQIPIVLGAIVFLNANRGVFSIYSELLLCILVFAGLVLFLIVGPGPYSFDNYKRRQINL